MTQHPITPPQELAQEWREKLFSYLDPAATVAVHELSCLASQWGADQELEACCALMDDWGLDGEDLMQCRRPKPPSLKEQALDALKDLSNGIETADSWHVIQSALEHLDG
jgi:hypothetical protein